MRSARLVVFAALLASLALALTGCYTVPVEEGSRPWDVRIGEPDGGVVREDVDVPRQGAQSLDARITMGAGELQLGSAEASDSVLTGSVSYQQGWPTRTEYSVDGTAGVLVYSQESSKLPIGDAVNRWELALAKGLPTRLAVTLGAGESELKVGELDLDDLQVKLGAGETMLDLTGPRTKDLPVSVQAGVGELRLVLPSDVGVRVSAREQGIGEFNADGFTLKDGYWTNDAWSGGGPKIDIDLEQGIGEVNLELAP